MLSATLGRRCAGTVVINEIEYGQTNRINTNRNENNRKEKVEQVLRI